MMAVKKPWIGRLIFSLFAGPLIGLAVAILFLPLFGLLDGSAWACLTIGWRDCLSGAIWGLLIFGPIFSILGLIIGAPALFIWLGKSRQR